MYMIAVQGVRGGGGEPFLLNNVLVTNGEGVGSHGGDFLEFGVLNTGFCALLSLN